MCTVIDDEVGEMARLTLTTLSGGVCCCDSVVDLMGCGTIVYVCVVIASRDLRSSLPFGVVDGVPTLILLLLLLPTGPVCIVVGVTVSAELNGPVERVVIATSGFGWG